MNRINLTAIKKFIGLILIVSIIFTFSSKNDKQFFKDQIGIEDNDNKYIYDEAAIRQFEFERTKDPALGYVSEEKLFTAYKYPERSKQIEAASRTASAIWIERGPNAKDIMDVKIFLNPVKNEMKISFSASGNGTALYQIKGLNGQLYLKKEEDISYMGGYIREWNIQNLKPGTYLFTVLYNDKKVTKKFSKI